MSVSQGMQNFMKDFFKGKNEVCSDYSRRNLIGDTVNIKQYSETILKTLVVDICIKLDHILIETPFKFYQIVELSERVC
jgi:hypothetical protein